MAMEAAASGAGCSDAPARLTVTLVDPVRLASQIVSVPRPTDRALTPADVLQAFRASVPTTIRDRGRDWSGPELERLRFADGLFRLSPQGALGEPISGLQFRSGGRVCDPTGPLDVPSGAAPMSIELDRSRSGYPRNWPAHLSRRWHLREDRYSGFVESVVVQACGSEAEAVLRRDTPDRARRFLGAITRRLHAAPYETYSRYLAPGTPFKSCDETLDRILEGDGGNCAEKAMALYFIAHAYRFQPEIVLGGEQASGKFPFRALRSLLDQRTFAAETSRDAQRHWQHCAILCQPGGDPAQALLCDVAGSNIPYLFLDAVAAGPYLDPEARRPLQVVLTLDPIELYYQRLERRQDIPLDLCYAMEHLIPDIDVIHTVHNELGLLHTGDAWLGVVAYRGRRELGSIVRGYERYVRHAGRKPQEDLAIVPALQASLHPLIERFSAAVPDQWPRLLAADPGLRRRVASVHSGADVAYAILNLKPSRADPPADAIRRSVLVPGASGLHLLVSRILNRQRTGRNDPQT